MKTTTLALWAAHLVLIASSQGAVVISSQNVPVISTFDSLPAASEFSTSAGLDSAGGGGAVTSAAGMDTALNANATVSAAGLTSALVSSSTWPTSQANLGRFNTGANTGESNGGFLQFRPTGCAYAVTMATLSNATGAPITALQISYDYFASTTSTADEDIDGLRAYYSLTGTAGSWVSIVALSADSTVTTGTISAPEALSTTLDLTATPWAAGTNFYILWADDNGPANADAANLTNERAYGIDNLSLTAVPEPTTLTAALVGLLAIGRRRRRA